MNTGPDTQKPIGYWLKRQDGAITAASNQALSSLGLTRFHWQVLNSVKEAGQITKPELLEILQDFLDGTALEDILAEFTRRSWLAVHPGGQGVEEKYEVTDSGLEAHRHVLELQGEIRRRLMKGVNQEEYAAMIRLLHQMVQNLER